MENNQGYYSYSKGRKPVDGKKITKIAVIVAVVGFLLVGVFTSFYTVDDKQQAVVTTFGQYTNITGAGLHFKLPYGIQEIHKVDVNVYQKIELGYTTMEDGSTVTNEDESTMITGDENIVNVDFFVEYKISDPVKYLFSSNNPELILRNLIQSQVRNVVGSSAVDDVLTTGKEDIERQVRELVTEILLEYDIGLTLINVRIQDAEPPTQEVIEAFKAVETAKQQAEAVENQALAYQNAQIPNAEAKVLQIQLDAEYQYTKRLNEAEEAVAMFEAMFAEFEKNPGITRSRMYYEMITKVLPGVEVYINTSDGETLDMHMILGNQKED